MILQTAIDCSIIWYDYIKYNSEGEMCNKDVRTAIWLHSSYVEHS
jgi:hypothetical protein